MPKEEIEIVEKFLDQFIFETDSKHTDQVDIYLCIRSVPCKIDEFNCHRLKLFDFPVIQSSIVAYKNSEEDQLHKYYDNRNKSRLGKLKVQAKRSSS